MYEFLNGLDGDLVANLIRRFQNLWMHGVVEAENETAEEENPWIFEIRHEPCGMPLAEYQKNAGHLRAIQHFTDLLCRLHPLNEEDLYDLHRMIIGKAATADPLEPIGAWKTESNGTFVNRAVDVHQRKECIYYQYADPADIPCLMNRWLTLYNHEMESTHTMVGAAGSYAKLHSTFVWIHPFFNGNGRLARLLSNGPVLKAGFPPILISAGRRRYYYKALDAFKLTNGRAERNTDLNLCDESLVGFCQFCRSCWRDTLILVAEARQKQEARNRLRENRNPHASESIA